MATSWTFATLSTALAAHMADTGTRFSTNAPTIIAVGEDKCVKDLDFEMWYVVDATKSTTQGSRLLTLPTGSLRVGDIALTVSSSYVPLDERTYSYCIDYAPGTTQVVPKYWSPYSETQIFLTGTPAAVYPVTMKHLTRPTGLSAQTTTTWLGTNVGDLLFHACLSMAEAFLKADERIATWETLYQQNLAAARQQFRALMRRDFFKG